jgi:Asp-tRNA(Asn)/Glu-tRNA(Gln) amidotransferase A subunit family amidase
MPRRSSPPRRSITAALDLVDEREPTLHALVPEPDRRGRVGTELAAPDRPRGGALDAVAVGVKDLIQVDGLPTQAGSTLPPEALAGPQARVIDRLRAAGAVVLGKTRMTEFAFQAPAATTNPRGQAHTPGGSSSGSAAAVAAGYTPLALGTQTVDSIVTPAAYCGVVGFKPSHGRVPVDGVVPFAPSADHLGLLAADIDMVLRAAPVIDDGWVPVPPIDAPRVAVPIGPYLQLVDDLALAEFRSTIAQLSAAGWTVEEVPALDDIDAVVADHRRLIAAEFAHVHRAWFERFGDRYRPRTAALIEEGRTVAPREAELSRVRAAVLSDRLSDALAAVEADAWVAPAATGAAPRGLDAIGAAVMSLPRTSAHLPAVTHPAGASTNGLPFGLQLIGRPDGDEALMEVAATAAAHLDQAAADGH